MEYVLMELGRIIAVGTKKEVWQAAKDECAVIYNRKTGDHLASGYTIEEIETDDE